MPDYIEEYLCQIKDNPDINQWDTLYTHLDAKEPLLMSVRLQDERGGRDGCDVGDVVAQEKRLIISGASGMGKTTTLKWLTLVYAENYLEGAERLIPLYVDLGRFRHGLFYDHVFMIAHENELEEEDFKELLGDGKLAIFLDGLDLLGGSGDFEPVIEIRNFMSEFSQCKFVLSSRPGFFEGFKSSCKVYELVELDDPKIKGYIHKYLGEGDKADALISRIFDSRNERLKLLCRNPMMLYLVIWLQENDKIADDRAGIYRESVEGIITHYRKKGKTLSSNEQLVRDVLKELAFSMQKENTVRMDYDSALDVVGSCISPERYKGVSAERVLEDCFGLGLLHKDGDDVRFGFHQSFQEYFAAVKLKEIFEYGYNISESFFHPKWEDTLMFLSEITERPDELIDDVISAGEIFLAAKLTLHVDDRRVENLCARLLDRVDSRYELEKYLAVESFAHIGDMGDEVLKELRISEGEGIMPNFNFVKAFVSIGDKGDVNLIINPLLNDKHDKARPVPPYEVKYPCGLTHKEELETSLKSDLGSDDKDVANKAFEMRYLIKRDNREKIFKELKYLLRWDDISGNDNDRLLRYFRMDHGITWAKRVEIRKSNDKTITIFEDENSAEITIDEGGEKATLKLSDGRTCDLNVRKKAKIGYATPSGVKGAEELRTDSHLGALIDRLKLVLDGTTVVDYGCGKGALLGRMNEIEKELEKIHYIGVDISRGNLYLARRTAERHYIADKLKSCRFVKKDEFFSEDIDINRVFFVHTLHEIPLKDLPEILYHLLSKMKAGSRITILEQMILVEPERDFVTWDADDFDMLFSGFAESSPRPYQTGRGHELISVDLERLNIDVSLESIRKRCLEVYEHKKERVGKERKSSDVSEGVRHYLSELYANIDSQIIEYQKSVGLDE